MTLLYITGFLLSLLERTPSIRRRARRDRLGSDLIPNPSSATRLMGSRQRASSPPSSSKDLHPSNPNSASSMQAHIDSCNSSSHPHRNSRDDNSISMNCENNYVLSIGSIPPPHSTLTREGLEEDFVLGVLAERLVRKDDAAPYVNLTQDSHVFRCTISSVTSEERGRSTYRGLRSSVSRIREREVSLRHATMGLTCSLQK